MKRFELNNNRLRVIYSLICITCFCSIIASSCKKFVQLPPPSTKLVAGNVFTNTATATSALTSIYIQLWNSEFNSAANLSLNFGLQADELQNYSTTQQEVSLYTNALNASLDQG